MADCFMSAAPEMALAAPPTMAMKSLSFAPQMESLSFAPQTKSLSFAAPLEPRVESLEGLSMMMEEESVPTKSVSRKKMKKKQMGSV